MRQLHLLNFIVNLFVSHAVTLPIIDLLAEDDGEKSILKGGLSDRQLDELHLQRRSYRFLTNLTSKFLVQHSSIPDVDFDIGESYSGLLPISDDPGESRKLFFWFFPSTISGGSNDLTIWLNGGPGCSSLAGLLQENGPFLWPAGAEKPLKNHFSWTHLTNMLWIDQPVGTGFTQGAPSIRGEVELAKQFLGFHKQFMLTFGLEESNIYLTGESWAGRYVPYIADAFISTNDACYFNLKGVALNDPTIGHPTVQQVLPMLQYAKSYNDVLNLNASVLSEVQAIQDGSCGWQAVIDQYFAFPPPAHMPDLPLPFGRYKSCDTFSPLFAAAYEANPCFNWYHISDTCPKAYSVIGDLDVADTPNANGQPYYFNRVDVKAAIHAPEDVEWRACWDATKVFTTGYDNSPAPALNGVLQRVIEYTNNVIIGSGNLDMLLPTNGTLMVLQNLTWNSQQGFQRFPWNNLIVPWDPWWGGAAQGIVGSWGAERGLTFYQIDLAGHQIPQYAPGAAYRVIQYMLGKISSLGEN